MSRADTEHAEIRHIRPADIDRLFEGLSLTGDDIETDLAMERSLLGGLITLDGWEVAEHADQAGIRPEHFRRDAHRHLYRAIRALMLEIGRIRPGVQRRPEAPDTYALCEYLQSRGLSEACGGLALAASIADRPAGPASAGWIVRQLRTAYARRELFTQARTLAEQAADLSRDVEAIAIERGAEIAQITDREASDDMSTAADLVGALNLDEAEPEQDEVISTGIEEVDRLLGGGLAMCRLTYMAGRPGHGKSALALNIAGNVARQGHAVAKFLLEMPAVRLDRQGRKRAGDFTYRLLTYASGVPIKAYQKYPRLPGRSRAEDEQAVKRAKAEVSQLPLYTFDVPGISYANLFASIRRLKARCPELRLVTIDYVGLVTGERGQDEQSILKATSNGLVKLANALGIHIICLSQLNRDCESTRDKRPLASHLRQSGELEQDADHLLMVQRPCKYEEWERYRDAFWIAERKGRHCEAQQVVIRFEPEEMWIGGPEVPDPVRDTASAGKGGTAWKKKH